jgi:hypothetical protein
MRWGWLGAPHWAQFCVWVYDFLCERTRIFFLLSDVLLFGTAISVPSVMPGPPGECYSSNRSSASHGPASGGDPLGPRFLVSAPGQAAAHRG